MANEENRMLMKAAAVYRERNLICWEILKNKIIEISTALAQTNTTCVLISYGQRILGFTRKKHLGKVFSSLPFNYHKFLVLFEGQKLHEKSLRTAAWPGDNHPQS